MTQPMRLPRTKRSARLWCNRPSGERRGQDAAQILEETSVHLGLYEITRVNLSTKRACKKAGKA